MSRIRYTLIVAILAMLSMAGCSESGETKVPAKNHTTTLQVDSRTWTYLNLQNGQIMGSSPLGDKEADAQWKNRNDWDIAFCGDMIRTNSGTSGNGEGGIQVLNTPYEWVEEAPLDGYITDKDDIEIYE